MDTTCDISVLTNSSNYLAKVGNGLHPTQVVDIKQVIDIAILLLQGKPLSNTYREILLTNGIPTDIQAIKYLLPKLEVLLEHVIETTTDNSTRDVCNTLLLSSALVLQRHTK